MPRTGWSEHDTQTHLGQYDIVAYGNDRQPKNDYAGKVKLTLSAVLSLFSPLEQQTSLYTGNLTFSRFSLSYHHDGYFPLTDDSTACLK